MTHNGVLLVLPNANTLFPPVMVFNVWLVHNNPSSLVAAVVVVSLVVTKNKPCPYRTLLHLCIDGKPNVLAYHVLPSKLYAVVVLPLATATNLPLPNVTLVQLAALGRPLLAVQTLALADELKALAVVPAAIATHTPLPYATLVQFDVVGKPPELDDHEIAGLLLYTILVPPY